MRPAQVRVCVCACTPARANSHEYQHKQKPTRKHIQTQTGASNASCNAPEEAEGLVLLAFVGGVLVLSFIVSLVLRKKSPEGAQVGVLLIEFQRILMVKCHLSPNVFAQEDTPQAFWPLMASLAAADFVTDLNFAMFVSSDDSLDPLYGLACYADLVALLVVNIVAIPSVGRRAPLLLCLLGIKITFSCPCLPPNPVLTCLHVAPFVQIRPDGPVLAARLRRVVWRTQSSVLYQHRGFCVRSGAVWAGELQYSGQGRVQCAVGQRRHKQDDRGRSVGACGLARAEL